MKLTLVAPATDTARRTGNRPKGTPYFHYYKLGIATLAGATPPEIDLEVIDETIDLWDPRNHATDAVAVSTMTALAPRAYALAEEFRDRGIPVILGGMHPTFLPDEARRYADAVVLGQGERVWPRVCSDLVAGRLQPVYNGCEAPPYISVPPARRDIFSNPFYPPLDIVQFSRGCIHRCTFCSVNAFFSRQYHRRPIEEVRAELAGCRRKHLMVADDNLYADREYCLEALEALAPLDKNIGIQATLDMALDREVMDAARAAKVRAVFVGIESFIPSSLAGARKTHNRIGDYAAALKEFHKRGIFVEGGLMFGFDHDGPDVFEHTMDQLETLRLDVAQIAIVTPMPGTELFRTLEDEGRITDRDWGHYDCNHAVFEPAGMTGLELTNGVEWFRKVYYSKQRIAQRSLAGLRWFDGITWATQLALNLGFRRNHLLGLDYPP